ncbi:MAG: hypothetical protein K6T31_00250 [Alicyclobacillus sp.]|nr:hypothetical protein [Alicyclobacillus sp.]
MTSTPLDVLVSKAYQKTVAIFGYREDGKLQADDLRQRGIRVVFGIRPDRDEYQQALRDGQEVYTPEEAARLADIVQVW